MRRQTGINGSKHESTYLTSIFLNISDGICVYVGMNLCTEINPPSYHAWRKIVEIQTKNGLCFLSTDSFTNRNRRRSVWSVIKHCVMQYISSSTLPIFQTGSLETPRKRLWSDPKVHIEFIYIQWSPTDQLNYIWVIWLVAFHQAVVLRERLPSIEGIVLWKKLNLSSYVE